MNQWQRDVEEFHRAMGHHISEYPQVPDVSVTSLRITLVKEEVGELIDALIDRDDLVGVADAIADAIVVILGTAVSYGIDVDPIWREVHRTNMNKRGGGLRADGKSLKPPGWQPPRIKELLIAQGARNE